MIEEHIEDWMWRHRGLNGSHHIGGATGIAIAGLALTAVGTGLSVYSSMQQGAAAAGTAGANAAIIKANAAIQLKSDRMQALAQLNQDNLSKENAGISLRMGQIDESNANLQGIQAQFTTAAESQNFESSANDYRIDASLSLRNASTLNNYARGTEAQGRDEVARFREQGDRVMSIANNRLAKSGIVSSGSPLQVMAKNAAMIELKVQDMHYETELTSRSLDEAAYGQRVHASRSLLAAKTETRNARTSLRSGKLAEIGTNFKIAGAKLEQTGAQYSANAADYAIGLDKQAYDLAGEKYNLALKTAGITSASGAAIQRAQTLNAIGTGVEGAATIAGGISNLHDTMPASSGGWKTQSGGTFNPNPPATAQKSR